MPALVFLTFLRGKLIIIKKIIAALTQPYLYLISHVIIIAYLIIFPKFSMHMAVQWLVCALSAVLCCC